MPRSRCLPQGLLKLVTSWPRGLQTQPACPAPFRPCRRCCTAQSVTFFSQLSAVFRVFTLYIQLSSLLAFKYLHLCLCRRLGRRSANSPTIHPRFTHNSPAIHQQFAHNCCPCYCCCCCCLGSQSASVCLFALQFNAQSMFSQRAFV